MIRLELTRRLIWEDTNCSQFWTFVIIFRCILFIICEMSKFEVALLKTGDQPWVKQNASLLRHKRIWLFMSNHSAIYMHFWFKSFSSRKAKRMRNHFVLAKGRIINDSSCLKYTKNRRMINLSSCIYFPYKVNHILYI